MLKVIRRSFLILTLILMIKPTLAMETVDLSNLTHEELLEEAYHNPEAKTEFNRLYSEGMFHKDYGSYDIYWKKKKFCPNFNDPEIMLHPLDISVLLELCRLELPDYIISQVQNAAEQGCMHSQYNMGYITINNYDETECEEDIQKAIDWYTKAADKGHTNAQVQLAEHYLSNEDIQKGINLYKMAAEQGNIGASLILAIMYDDSEKMNVNYKEFDNVCQENYEQRKIMSANWATQAALQGHSYASKWLFENHTDLWIKVLMINALNKGILKENEITEFIKIHRGRSYLSDSLQKEYDDKHNKEFALKKIEMDEKFKENAEFYNELSHHKSGDLINNCQADEKIKYTKDETMHSLSMQIGKAWSEMLDFLISLSSPGSLVTCINTENNYHMGKIRYDDSIACYQTKYKSVCSCHNSSTTEYYSVHADQIIFWRNLSTHEKNLRIKILEFSSYCKNAKSTFSYFESPDDYQEKLTHYFMEYHKRAELDLEYLKGEYGRGIEYKITDYVTGTTSQRNECFLDAIGYKNEKV